MTTNRGLDSDEEEKLGVSENPRVHSTWIGSAFRFGFGLGGVQRFLSIFFQQKVSNFNLQKGNHR